MTEYGVDEMDEYLAVADTGKEGSAQETLQWVQNNPLKAVRLLWYYENNMRELRR